MGLILGIGIGIPWGNSLDGGSSYPTEGIPQVTGSIITSDQQNGILVRWDRPMLETCDVKDQIHVVINSNAPALPISIVFNGDQTQMGIVMAANFQAGDSVEWSYTPAGACELRQIADPFTEADGTNHVVISHIIDSPLWETEHGDQWVDEHVEDWAEV